MANLADILKPQRIAIVGMAKNCGKTTTLNALARAYRAADETIGLVSIGIDGETSDVLLGTPKPPVRIGEGQLVVTADGVLASSGTPFEWLDSLNIRTPLGETVLVRALGPGDVVLGGLRHRSDVERATQLLLENGAEHVLIDGAYGRVTGAAPDLSDATLVSTGAIVDADEDGLARLTLAFLERLDLPRATDADAVALGRKAVADRANLIRHQGRTVELPSSSALLALRRGQQLWVDGCDTLVVSGLVSDGVVDQMMAMEPPGRLLLPDATVLQCSDENFARLRSSWLIEVLEPIRVDGVALNPTSLRGDTIDAQRVAESIVSARPNLTVFNPLLGLHSLV